MAYAGSLRIAILTSSYPQGSIAAAPFLLPFVEELKRLRIEPVVFFPRLAAGAPSSASEVPIEWSAHPRPLVGLSLKNPRDLALLVRLSGRWERAVEAAHREKPFDLILALWAVPSGLVARRLSRRLGVPYMVWSLGSDVNAYGRKLGVGRVVRTVLRDATAVCANSNVLAEKIRALTGREVGFLATSRPVVAPARAATLPEGSNFLFLGRLERVKGPDVLIDAAAILAERTGGWHLTIAGDGTMARQLHERVRSDPSLSGRITFPGHVDGERLLSYLFACDCIVIPSRSESLPVVFSEGLQAGKPFVVTDVGDMGDLTERYGLGEVVEPDDARQLAGALETVVRDGATPREIDPEVLQLLDIGRSAEEFSRTAHRITGRSPAPLRSSWVRRVQLVWSVLAIAILFFLARSLIGNWSQLDISFEKVRWGWLALSGLAFIGSCSVSALLWHESLAIVGDSPGYATCLRTMVLAQLAKYLPGGIWAVVGQVELSKKAGVPRGKSVVAMGLMSAALVVSGLVFGAIVGAPIMMLGPAKVAAAALGVVLLMASMHPAVFSRIVRATFLVAGRQAPRIDLTILDVARVLLYAIVYWPCAGLAFFLMAGAVVRVSPADLLPFAGAYAISWTLGYVAVFAPGGLGVREPALVFFLARIVGFTGATLIALSQRVWFTLMELVMAAGLVAASRIAVSGERGPRRAA